MSTPEEPTQEDEAPEEESPKVVVSQLAAEDYSPRAFLALLRDLYLTFDRRTLGFARIMLGFLLCMDLLHRRVAWDDMYSSIGVLPTHLNLQRPQAWGAYTIFNAFETPGELHLLWWIAFVNAFCLLIGYRTKLAQILAVFFVAGMNGRVLLIENGGYVVNNLLAMWTAFLPMGDRISVDALLASMRRRRETTAADLNDRSDVIAPGMDRPFVSAVGAAIVIQLAAIYFFNVVHKTGPAWKNGTAVHYVLYVDRMATPLIGAVRDHIPNAAILFMTKSAMAMEGLLPVAILAPVARVWARRAVVFMINNLHLAFGTTFVLGPFAWSCCVFSTLFFSKEDWEIAYATMRRTHRARAVVFDPRSGGALLACRLLKRLDRFDLLTFEAEEGVPLGIGVRRPAAPDKVVGHTDALADVVAALPLGPLVAWIPRILKIVLDPIFGALEKRDVSRFLGLTVEAPPGRATPAPETPAETPRIPALAVILPVLAVAGAIAVGVLFERALWGILLVGATVIASAVITVYVVFPTVTFRLARRTAFGAVREALVLAMLAGAINQGLTELWCINRRWKAPQPEPLRVLSHKFRYLQGWFMFSPNPVMEDGTIVVDAVTVDGRHVDPFTGKEPFFDILHVKSFGLTQIWCDYFNRIQLPSNVGYRDAMKDYMYRLPDRTGRPNDAIVSGDVYWVKAMNPRWNEKEKYGFEKNKLFSFENPAAQRPVAD